MAKVTGKLSDYQLGHLVGLHPTLHFQPSGLAVGGAEVFAPETVVATPDAQGGYFEVDLQPTTGLRPAAHYTVTARWGSGRNAPLPGKLSVPPDGGVLADLLQVPAVPAQVWVDTAPPPELTPGVLWLNRETGTLQEWSP